MPNASQSTSDFKGDHISVKMYGAVDDWDSIAASAILTFTGQPTNGETVTIDGQTYTYKNTLSGANDVLIGASKEESARNLSFAVSSSLYVSYEGIYYGTGTVEHATCESSVPLSPPIPSVTIRFSYPGPSGNGTPVSETVGAATWSSPTLIGGGESGTDNTVAIQTALSALRPGQTLLFPAGGTGKYLITAPLYPPRGAAGVRGCTLKGTDKLHCQIVYVGTQIVPAVINMMGCDSITWKDIAVIAWSDNPAFFPKTIIMLGRTPDHDLYGHHDFHRCAFMGNASHSIVYSIGSEENNWNACYIFGNNGKANAGTADHLYYTSYKDDLGICVPEAIVQSNLDIWMSKCHLINFAPGASTRDCVFIGCYAGSGDMVFRDCYMSAGALFDMQGWIFRFSCDPVYLWGGTNYVVECCRGENAEGMFRFELNGGPGYMSGTRLANNSFAVPPGETGYMYYGEDDVTIYQCDWHSNFFDHTGATASSSVDKMQNCRIVQESDEDFTVRTIATYSYFHFSSSVAVLTIPSPASFFNTRIFKDRTAFNGPLILDDGNAFENQSVAISITDDPGDRSFNVYYDASNGMYLLYHYDSTPGFSYGTISTYGAETPLALLADSIALRAATGSGIAGNALTLLVNKNIINLYGRQWIDAIELGEPIILTRDADGTTDGFSFTLQTFAGINYFSVYGGSNAVNPGFLQTRGHIPFADDTYDLGNAGLLWRKIWTHQLLIADLGASGPLLGIDGSVGYGKIDLSSAVHVENALAVVNGGTGSTSAAGARANLGVYSAADVDALIANLQSQINSKATGGIQTGAASAGTPHTHTQLI